MGYLLQNFETFDLWKIEHHDLADFTKFVLRIYYEHHMQTPAPVREIKTCIQEDKQLFPSSHFYALKTKDGEIFGTINACLWNGKDKLAIEREYNINLNDLIKTRCTGGVCPPSTPPHTYPPQIWHVGRFAIDRQIINRNTTLQKSQSLFFRLLLTCVFVHICTHPDNLMIAECDKKLHETVKKLGIFSEPLSNEHFVLGSQALPILNTGAGLQPFFEKHKHLLSYVQQKQNLHQ